MAVTGIMAKKFSSDRSKLVVSWTPLTLTQARGFITEYTVAYNTIDVSESKTYEVSITCYTSKGAGPSSKKVREEDGGTSGNIQKSL